jgi:hypothetical protein
MLVCPRLEGCVTIESNTVEQLTVPASSQPKDFRSFVKFFKGYMGVMPLVVASFAPIVTLLNAIPTYSIQTKTLSTMTGLLGFLLVAWAFSSRHSLAVRFFYVQEKKSNNHYFWALRFSLFRSALGIPFCLIVLMIGFFFAYSWMLEHSIMVAQVDELSRGKQNVDELCRAKQDYEEFEELARVNPAAIMITAPKDKIPPRSGILKQENYRIPYGTTLVALYVGIFLCAELAFVFMALREYMQSVLKLSDEVVIQELTGRKVSV